MSFPPSPRLACPPPVSVPPWAYLYVLPVCSLFPLHDSSFPVHFPVPPRAPHLPCCPSVSSTLSAARPPVFSPLHTHSRHTVQQQTNHAVAASASALKQMAELLRGCSRVCSLGPRGGETDADHAAARGRGRAFLCSLGRGPDSGAGAVGSRPPGQECPVPLPCSTCPSPTCHLYVCPSCHCTHRRPPQRGHGHRIPDHGPFTAPMSPPPLPTGLSRALQPWPAVCYPHPTCSPRGWGSPEHAVLLSPRGLQSRGLFSSVKLVCCPFVYMWPRAASSYSSRDPPPNPKS